MGTSPQRPTSIKYNRRFVLVLAAFLCLVGAGSSRPVIRWIVGDRTTSSEVLSRASLPALQHRNTAPVELCTFPLIEFRLSDEHRKMILSEVSRWCNAKSGQMGALIHALRLRALALKNPDIFNVALFEAYLNVILDDTHYRKWALGREPILFDTIFGAAYRVQGVNPGSEYVGGMTHVDKVLSTLGELGFPLTTSIVTHSGQHKILADVLEDSLKRWTPMRESEWSLAAYCDYLHHQVCWTSATREACSLDDVLHVELSRRTSSCFGTHRLYALAKACMRERATPGTFSAHLIQDAELVLRTASRALTQDQHQDGGWSTSWDSVSPKERESSLAVTGHMLEWFSIVHEDLRPSRDVIERAARYVEKELIMRPEKHFGSSDLPAATHAVRGLFNLCCTSDPTETTERR